MKNLRILVSVFAMIVMLCVCAFGQEGDTLAPFQQFRVRLEDALKQAGRNPDQETFHFVVLLSTMRTQGPAAQGMRNIYYGLLNEYCVDTPEAKDIISFAPYEMSIRTDWKYPPIWNQTFSQSSVADYYNCVPDAPEPRSTHGGHDSEGALLEAIKNTTDQPNAVYIVLSDTEESHAPTDQKDFILTNAKPDFQETLTHDNIKEVAKDRLSGNFTDPQGADDGSTTVFYRIYLPTVSQSAGTLAQSRSQLIADRPAPPPPPTPGGAAKDPPKESPEGVSANVIAGILVALALAALGGYYYWLTRPRNIQIGSETGVVKFGQQLVVGGKNIGRSAFSVPEIADGLKVGKLEVTPMRVVVLRSHGSYKIGNGQVQFKPASQTVHVKDKSNVVRYQLNIKSLK